MVDNRPLVTLTGISGYLGSWTGLKFLQDGGYRVRGTVRDLTNEAKLAPLRVAFGDLFSQLELVQADLDDEQSLVNAIQGSTYVLHIASVFDFSIPEAEMIAIWNMAEADKPADRMFDESHWANPNRPEPLLPYFKSKVIAEKAAWDFHAALPADQKFELVTINAAKIMGPPLRKERNLSSEWCKSVMLGTMETVSSDHVCVVDVRDAAQAHLQAIKVAGAANRRFVVCHSSPSFQEYAQPIVDKYGPLGWPVATNKAPVNPDEYIHLFNNTSSKQILGLQYHDFNQTMVDMADKMVEIGYVVKP